MSCECAPQDRYVRYSGMGGIEAVAMAQALSDAKNTWDHLVEALGIGAGRREADAIVPYQNKILSDVFGPIGVFYDAVTNKGQPVDCNEANQLLGGLNATENQWLNFLRSTKWPDGRAAQQAEAGMQPYFTNTRAGLKKLIADNCSTSVSGVIGDIGDSIGDVITSITKTSTGETNWPVIAGVAGLAYMFLRKK